MTAGARLVATVALALLPVLACAPSAPCGLRQCDIRDPGCQRDIVRATACLRGQPPVDFPVTLKPQQVYIAEAEAAAAAVTEAELQAWRVWQGGLALLDLADPRVSPTQSAREQAAWVAAYYQPSDRAVTVIDIGRALDSREAVTLLVHEAMHALQDATVGLEAFRQRFPADLDRLLASKAVTEGEASLIEDLAALGLFGGDEQDVKWDPVFGFWQRWARQEALDSPMPVDLAWGHFPYPYGTPYVQSAFRAGGRGALDQLYAAPPASAGQVLAGFGVAAPDGGAWAEELGAEAVPQPPAPWQAAFSDRMGAWVWSVFIDRLNARLRSSSAAAVLARARLGLRGDRLTVLHDQAGAGPAVLAAWRLRLDTAALASEVAQVLELAQPRGLGWRAAARERDVILLGGAWPVEPGQLSFGPVPPSMSVRASAAPAVRCLRRLPDR